jgi:ComF family protein
VQGSNPIIGWLASARDAFDALVLPTACRVCGADVDRPPYCPDCRAEVLAASGPSCPRCAMPTGPWEDARGGCSECRGRSIGFDRALAIGPYQGPIRDLCLALKHETNAWLARWAADLLIESKGDQLRANSPERVVPVPLHWRRALGRGYNQAEALAERLASRLGARLIPALRRAKWTPKLSGKGRTERLEQLRGAFRPRGAWARSIPGRTVLLVDDILTSGATCGEAARALKRAGAARVVVAVIGRAEGRA